MIGLFQVATVYLLYRLCLLVDAPWAGLCSAGLYATSGLVVYWSRFLWPNITPFFVVLVLYALVALAQGRSPRFLVLLAASLAAATQMQPTALLLVPVAVIWLLAVRPRVTPRLVLLASGVVVLLFAPVIAYDLAHRFADARAWLGYGTTVRPGAAPRNGFARGLAALERFGWQAVGFRTRARVDLLLVVAALAVVGCAAGLNGRSRSVLARLLLLWAVGYLLAFALYRGALHPHYVEPLFPLPFLAVALFLDLVVTAPLRLRLRSHGSRRALRCRGPAGVPSGSRRSQGAAPAAVGVVYHATAVAGSPRLRAVATLILGAGAAAVVVGLATANVRHLWADQFGLDAFQLDSPADVQGNRVTLGEMRHAADLVARSAAGRPYSFLLAVRDGAGGGFAYLQRQTSAPPATTLRPLQFLLVEPADRPPWLWPPATRLRWSRSAGGFVRLPHLLLWRIRPAGGDPESGSSLWQSMADTTGQATALAMLPGSAGRVVAGFIGGAATRAQHNRTWRRAEWPAGPNGRAVISAFAASPACPTRLYAATFDGVLASADGGATWRPAPAQPASPEVLSLLANPRRCGTLLAGTRAGITRTTDGGAHWQSVAVGGARRLAVQALTFGPRGSVYAGTTDGVWKSFDGGMTWPPLRQRGEPRPALSLLVHPAGAPILLAGSGAGLLYSGDGGRTWAPTGSGLQATVYCLLDAEGHGTLLAGTDAGLYISHDNGALWQPVALPAGTGVKALAAGARRTVYAATSLGVYQSLDGGATWQSL